MEMAVTRKIGIAAGAVVSMTVLMTAQDRDRAKVADAYKWNLADVYPSQATWKGQKEKITAEIPRLGEFRGVVYSRRVWNSEGISCP